MKCNFFNVWDNTKCIADAKTVAALGTAKEHSLGKAKENKERIFIHLLSNLKLIQVISNEQLNFCNDK